jgi:hypothetical protein
MSFGTGAAAISLAHAPHDSPLGHVQLLNLGSMRYVRIEDILCKRQGDRILAPAVLGPNHARAVPISTPIPETRAFGPKAWSPDPITLSQLCRS